MQYEDYFLAWWFNVGVQIFLCISGYLYGQKNVGNIAVFYRKRFIKILVPYYIIFTLAGVIEVLFFKGQINLFKFGGGFVLKSTIAGGEHLWFVPMILFCYVLTPILEAYRDNYINNSQTLLVVTIHEVVVVSIFGGMFADFFNPAWLSCYVLGYALGVNEKKKLIRMKNFMIVFGIFAVVGNGIQVYCDHFRCIAFSGYMGTVFRYFQNYNHICLGVFLFLLMKMVFDNIKFSKMTGFLDIADAYSYETYLVHQFLILGPMSLMALTPWLPLNIVAILIGIAVLSCLLKKAENSILKMM